ncbi:MAG: GAF domain-containing protein [Chloroflexi bacterium]|nr:GAF domain-containing protein [Chloroflexota bacterium]
MPELSPITLGITLIATGIGFYLLTPLLLRAISRKRPKIQKPSPPPKIHLNLSPSGDATLLIQPGGLVKFANQAARDWFSIQDDEPPNLEHLARYTNPSETFLSLCATPGQARFTLQKTLVEGASYAVPHENEQAVLVTLRRPQLSSLTPGQDQPSTQAFSLFKELSLEMTSSLDLETTIKTILESIEQLVPADLSEITLWDEQHEHLVPYRFSGAEGLQRKLSISDPRLITEESYSSYLASMKSPLLIDDIDAFEETGTGFEKETFPFRSFLGIPLLSHGETVGTIELASQNLDTFSSNDLEILQVLSDQAAIALQNAHTYYQEQQRAVELAGLAELAQISGSIKDPKDLIERLIESLAPILKVEILGILLYNESRKYLEGQIPFKGMPPQFMDLYRAHIKPDSPAERIWLSEEPIQTEKVSTDPGLTAFGLNHLAQTAGIRSTVLVPLISSGRALGYLQAANKTSGLAFDSDDVQMLTVLAGQAAPILENASLIQEARQRTQRSEALRRIASLAGSAATLPEILKFSLQELSSLIKTDTALIYLLNENVGVMRPHEASITGMPLPVNETLKRISTNDPGFKETATFQQSTISFGDVKTSEEFPPIYQPLIDSLENVKSIAMIPLIIRDQGLGEIIVSSQVANFFQPGDLQSIATVASQLASATERSTLSTQTDESLQRRVQHLTALTRISRELNTTLELEHLLKRVYDEILNNTKADGGSILLFDLDDPESNFTKILLQIGDHPGPGLSALEEAVIEGGQPLIVEDFSQSKYASSHEGIRSALTAPIAYQENIAGLINLQAKSSHKFDDVTLEITQALAVQAAIAIGNAQRYQEQVQRGEMLSRRVDALDKLFETIQTLHIDQPLEDSLESIAYGIQESTPFEVVLAFVYDPEIKALHGTSGAGLPLETLNEIRDATYFWESIEKLLVPKFRLSNSYFIPSDDLPEDSPTLNPDYSLLSYTIPDAEENIWEPGDMLLVPLYDPSNRPLGLISVDAPRNGLHPDNVAIETLEIFTTEATLVIESFQKMRELRDQVRTIQTKVSRAEKASDSSQTHLSVLLHKDLEQTIAIRRLNDRSRRIRVGLDIAEIANRQPDRSAVLMALGHQMLTQMDLDIALVAEQSSGGPNLIHSLGSTPAGVNPEALMGQRNPLHQTFRTGETILIPNVENDPEWQNTPLLNSLNARGFISLPISSNGKVEAAVLAISHSPISTFTPEDEQIYDLIANQVAIALQNLNLLTETRRRLREVDLLLDFSRQIGSLDPNQILQTLAQSALRVMANAHAGIVVMWNPEQRLLVTQAAVGYTNNDLIKQITYKAGEALPGQVYRDGEALSVDEVDFAEQYDLTSENLLAYREATGGRLPVSSLLIPIKTGETTLGVVALDNFNLPAAFTEEDEALVTSLAQQTALTLDNARLFQGSEKRAQELDRRSRRLAQLNRISNELSASLDTDHLLEFTTKELFQAINCSAVSAILFNENGIPSLHKEAPDVTSTLPLELPDAPLFDHIRKTLDAYVSEDITRDQSLQPLVDFLEKRNTKSLLALPLETSTDLHGLLLIHAKEQNSFTADEVELALTISNQAAVGIENAYLFEESRRSAEELEQRVAERTQELAQEHQATRTLLRISTELSSSLDLDQVLNRSLELLNKTTNAHQSSIILIQPGEENLVYRAGQGHTETPPAGGRPSSFKPGEGVAGWVIENRESLVIANLLEDDRWVKDHGETITYRSVIAAPLTVGADALGAVMLFHNDENHFSERQLNLVQAAANQFAVAINNGELYRLIRDQAESLGSMLRAQQVEASRSTAMLEGVADGVLVTDSIGTITLFNNSSETILGLERDRVLGKSLEEFIGLFGGTAQAWMDTIRAWSEDPKQQESKEVYSEHILLEDGRVVSVRVAPVSSRDEFLGTVSVFRDITHHVEVDRLKSEFVATVSHELRTPMTPIKGYVEFLLMGGAGELNEQQSKFLGIIQGNIDRLGILVNDLLDVSRIEAGKVALSFQPLMLHTFAEEVIEETRRQSKEEGKPMTIELDVESDLPLISGDPERIRQVLSNIVDNSYNYTPENGKIQVRIRLDVSKVHVEVQDNGIGIFPDDQVRIFERFYRGENPLVMAVAGTGLGLAIVKELVDMHDGEIWVESSGIPGEGSKFTFTLPAIEAADHEENVDKQKD